MPTTRKPINVAEAKAHLAELIDRASKGEVITIARNGEPQALLVPLPAVGRRTPGLGAGQWLVQAGFDDPLPAEVEAAFEGGTT